MFQPELTHASDAARSRLDRIYSNHHNSEQLDRQFKAVALEWKHSVSNHRAVLFSRQRPQKLIVDDKPLSQASVTHEDFPRRVALNYNSKVAEAPHSTDIEKLVMLKTSMREVSTHIDKSSLGHAAAISFEDRLGVTIRFIRAFESGFLGVISTCLARYPTIKDKIANPYDIGGNITLKLQRLRDHAIELAKDHALGELGQAHKDLSEGDNIRGQYKKQKANRLIHRLAPGRSGTVAAIRDKNENINTTIMI